LITGNAESTSNTIEADGVAAHITLSNVKQNSGFPDSAACGSDCFS
jgi:hypothetical protein